MSTIEYRVEQKYLVSDLDLALIAGRLKAVMKADIHQDGDCYEVRSIYLDDIWDSCMNENEDGVDNRKKYRIRTYDTPGAPLRLEIKEKYRGFTKKSSAILDQQTYEGILSGDDLPEFGSNPVVNQLLLQMRRRKLQPKIAVVYQRTAFVYPTGNVRITFDRNIMATRDLSSFLDPHVSGLVPVLPTGMHVLEVKYDELLPDVIAGQLEIGKLRQTAFSKYYLGRLAVNGEFPIGK
ncbi:MAG: polyphosphate polymerase domain-containing protein [Oscillospiraceae bacterium]|nr:polyphosphate polymerase domain-containing protein [Oscillospiraceae bacterium]